MRPGLIVPASFLLLVAACNARLALESLLASRRRHRRADAARREMSLPSVMNQTCASLELCSFCHSFGSAEDCAETTHCEWLHYVHRSSMLNVEGADQWLNCTARDLAGEWCTFRFVVDRPRNLLFTDIHSMRCTGHPGEVAGLVAGALLLMWLVLAVGLGLPMRLLDAVRGRSLERSYSGAGSTRSSTRGSTRSGASRRTYSVRSN